jgi:hypothetical protein
MFIIFLLFAAVTLLLLPKSFWKRYHKRRAEAFGFALLLFPFMLAWSFRPAFFYQQKTGTVINITESKHSYKSTIVDIYIFDIDGKKIEIRKRNNENYDYLIGKAIKYRSDREGNSEDFVEITYNDQIVYSLNEDTKWLFVFSLIISILILSLYTFKFG